MKLTKKTLNAILLIILAILAYFFGQDNQKPQNTPSSQSKPQPTVAKNTTASSSLGNSSNSGGASYDSIMAEDKIGQNANAPVHYYMLALSWSPSFCDSQRDKNRGNVPQHLKFQCAGSQEFGWVIHGLWAQNKNARSANDHPRYCKGDLPPLPASLIEKYLPESPGMNLLQGQWEKHGACAFDNAEDYFAKQKVLFQSIKLPNVEMRKNELFRWVRKNNPQLERVYLGASKNELYICYDKNWKPMDCPK